MRYVKHVLSYFVSHSMSVARLWASPYPDFSNEMECKCVFECKSVCCFPSHFWINQYLHCDGALFKKIKHNVELNGNYTHHLLNRLAQLFNHTFCFVILIFDCGLKLKIHFVQFENDVLQLELLRQHSCCCYYCLNLFGWLTFFRFVGRDPKRKCSTTARVGKTTEPCKFLLLSLSKINL